MDQPGTVFNGDKITQYHVMGRLLQRQKGKERLVAFAFQLLAFHVLQHYHFIIAKDFLKQRFC